ncbi:beta-ketoacyl-ACP synthase II [Desulfobacterota bacterium AH_259_B03_O07]|nr:beta-ketoacyl-ACP synthase II [Desulfobacterota bacterium AH_259_B03_O07]
MKRRVAVTGIGLITPLGTGNAKTWDGICEGRSGVRTIQKFDPVAADLKTHIAGEVIDFEPDQFMDAKELRKTDPFIHFAIAATKIALEESSLEITSGLSPRVGVLVGTGIGGMEAHVKTHITLLEKGPSRISPFYIPSMITNMAAGYISIRFNAKGPNCCTTTACAASAHAIGYARQMIQMGDADVMIAGGTEATLIPLAVAGFNAMRALSTRNDEPHRASRPFDRDRDGFILSEGSGMLILEELEFAKKRGARIYAELIGFGMSSDAHHITSPTLDGPVRCMNNAMRNAEINADQIDYINAHGTSTPQNDVNETRAIKEVLNNNAYKVPVSSTKSMTGHLLGASGGVESAITVLSLYHGVIPPTINLDNPDPECDLDYVPHCARESNINIALSNSFGFGGTNCSLAFRRFND